MKSPAGRVLALLDEARVVGKQHERNCAVSRTSEVRILQAVERHKLMLNPKP